MSYSIRGHSIGSHSPRSSRSYEEDDELDIRLGIHRGRGPSPVPVVYPEHRYRPSPRPYNNYGRESSYLIPGVSGALHRSRSTGARPSAPPAPAPAPVIISNRIYNDFDDDDYALVVPSRTSGSRSRSRTRPSFSAPRDPRDEYELERQRRELDAIRSAHTRDEYEIEKARRELEKYKLGHTRDEYEIEKSRREIERYRLEKDRLAEEARIKKQIAATKENLELEKTKKEIQAYKAEKQRKAEEERLRKEIEYKRLQDEKKADDAKKQKEKDEKEAIEKYKIKQAEEAAKAKKEKDAREKEYQARLEEGLRKFGMDERQINGVLKKEMPIDPNRPTYTKMSRKHLSIETLNRYNVDFEYDRDPDYVLIRRWVPEYEQDFLWSHTREIREKRRLEPALLMIEPKKHHHHHETELALVRKKSHSRKPSPSPVLAWVAGRR